MKNGKIKIDWAQTFIALNKKDQKFFKIKGSKNNSTSADLIYPKEVLKVAKTTGGGE